MSKPPEQENGAHGANTANGTPGAYDTHGGIQSADVPEAPEVPPNVYHPQSSPSPVYETYLDPAAAHGWQNAYDETTELPPVVDGTDGAHEVRGVGDAGGAFGSPGVSGGYDYVYEDGYDYGDGYDAGRGGRRSHRGRHQPSVWNSRRVAVAAGLVGVLSVGVLIAGFSLSGSSSPGGEKTKGDRTSATSGDPVVPGVPSAGASAGVRGSDDAGPPRSASQGAPASPSASADADADADADSDAVADSGDRTDEPSTTPSTTSEAPSTPTAAAPPTADKPGRGLGNGKKPG
ncbi:hypothetical protein [Streptomyces sp. NPDC059010]|uniref:hypothetical protein n=1 Tax=Streptomyces sp. NPDC059010 TaxID=3346695 RepID=UPI00367F55AD